MVLEIPEFKVRVAILQEVVGARLTPSSIRRLNPNFSAIFLRPAGVKFSMAVLPNITLLEVAKAFCKSKLLIQRLLAGSFN